MASRKPHLPKQFPPLLEPFRSWLAWAANKLGFLPEALIATADWNPGNVAFGASLSTTLRVPGAQMGDAVAVGFTDEEAGVLFTGQVRAPDVVRVVLTNISEAGTAFNMNAGTLTVIVWRAI